MAVPRLSSRELIQRLKVLGAVELPKRGKGSHTMFQRLHTDGIVYKTVVPLAHDCVAPGTVGSIRRGLRLTREDGCSDYMFYGR
jgi:predicted RNA binding protein YcfA (HicA-like mRNA interferase family)